uniref:Uncharacterized protein n=1 Tax=Utricularia reniformis TaxID=192314 RepID=A0A1Y0B2X5_9LAMI|nr:hypothetical protein AEK19_MT1610 [Utricularia reniformis]ART31795.1 hypothetical protein AEK19_MT1610 [Utricularia reniformis]
MDSEISFPFSGLNERNVNYIEGYFHRLRSLWTSLNSMVNSVGAPLEYWLDVAALSATI